MATADGAAPAQLVFVLGTGRCGSTVVEEVLCRHPGVGFVSNLEDLFSLPASAGRWNGSLYRRLPANASRKGRARFAPSEGYRILDKTVSRMLSTSFRDPVAQDVTPWLERRMRTFFLERAAAQGVNTFLHKFTGWPRAGFLARVFPNARFIHIVRDGRAVANSWLQMPWWVGYSGPDHWQWGALPEPLAAEWEASGGSFVVLAGLLWEALMDAHDEARGNLPADRWLEIRYEDVAARPRESFATMIEFCGLDWDAEFERGFGRHVFDRSRTDAFRRDLNAADVAALTRSLARPLAAHGYDASE